MDRWDTGDFAAGIGEQGGRADHVVGGGPAALAKRGGNCAGIGVQALADLCVALGEGGIGRRERGAGIEGIDDLLDDLGLGIGAVAGAGVGGEVEAGFGETGFGQVFEHDFAGNALFGDEEDALALGQKLGGDVGDGLALAGARGALDDEALADGGHPNGLQLVGIGIDDDTERARGVAVIGPGGARFGGLRGSERFAPGDRREEGMGGQAMEGAVDFFDHGELGEGEDVDHRAVFLDEPAVLAGDDLADRIEVEGE